MFKKLICAFALILALAVGGVAQADLASWEAAISAASPLNWYKFNETAGTDCLDSGSGALKGVYNGATPAVEGFFGAGSGAQFVRANMTRVDFAGATDLSAPYTAEYIVKTSLAGPANQQAQAMHDGDISGLRLAGWSALSEIGFVLYGVADYRFTPEPGFTLNDLVAPQNKWLHLAFRNNGTAMQVFVNGKLMGSQTNLVPLGRLRIGSRVGSSTSAFEGVLDEAVVFNRALSDADIIKHALAGSLLDESVLQASRPSPADGSIVADTWVNMTWSPGTFAVSHDVYLGDNFEDVNSGTPAAFRDNQGAASFLAGILGFPYPDGLVPGTTYYWRIDQVEADGTKRKGRVWSFMIPPRTGYNPNPADGAKYVPLSPTLGWTGGLGAKLHTVYFGNSFADVNNATQGVVQTTTTFTPPGPLTKATTYYWRVDEFDGAARHKGNVWSFSTLPIIAIQDATLMGWWSLDEGSGTLALDWSGHDNNGNLDGGPQWVTGQLGQALAFANSRVTVPASGSLTANLFQAPFTLAAWINPKRTGNTWQQVFRAIKTDGTSNDTLFLNNDGRLSWRGRVAATWTTLCETLPGVVPANQWTHVAVTGDATNFRIYVNGALSQESGFQKTDGTNANYYIGGNPGATAEFYAGMTDDVRIYNKSLTAEEIAKAMRGDLLLAWNASPANGRTVEIGKALPLTWSAGDGATQHGVYFGANQGAVDNADASDTTGIYRGLQAGPSYNPPEGVQWGGGPYFWRVDEVLADGTVSKGTLWSFSVANYLVVDDIESYNDLVETDPASNRIYKKWIDGFGTTTNGAVVGNLDVPLTERANVHGGAQAMPLSYDNNLKYSEATLTLTAGNDWTREGVANLSLWYRGLAANAAEQMYVVLNGTAVVYNTNATAAQRTAWTEWVIPLKTFADLGVNLTNVTSITIGFGTRGNKTVAGGTGQMYIDDIRLTRP